MFMVKLLVCLATCQVMVERQPTLFEDEANCHNHAVTLVMEIKQERPEAQIGFKCVRLDLQGA